MQSLFSWANECVRVCVCARAPTSMFEFENCGLYFISVLFLLFFLFKLSHSITPGRARVHSLDSPFLLLFVLFNYSSRGKLYFAESFVWYNSWGGGGGGSDNSGNSYGYWIWVWGVSINVDMKRLQWIHHGKLIVVAVRENTANRVLYSLFFPQVSFNFLPDIHTHTNRIIEILLKESSNNSMDFDWFLMPLFIVVRARAPISQQWHFRMKIALWNLCNGFQYGNVSLVADFHSTVVIINLPLPKKQFLSWVSVCTCACVIKSRYAITVNCLCCFRYFRMRFLACWITLITNINHVCVCRLHICIVCMCLVVVAWLPSFGPKIIHMHFQYCSVAFHIYA